ncbi:MAG: dihydropteroate synthase [Flavobacteriia bacterium]|nr:dihydropteroate synthase [Flavobacteriia bacterium]
MQKLKVEDTHFPVNNYLRAKDKLLDLSIPKVMGIVNCTPDSFYSTSRLQSENAILKQVEKHLIEGADILDLGGYSSRPGAENISEKEEIKRILTPIQLIRKEFSEIPISLDTFRAEVAKIGLENGIDIINDISAFELDSNLLNIVGNYKCPYILMHMHGVPQNMQNTIQEGSIFKNVCAFLSQKIEQLHQRNVTDIIIDPGFGFGKSMEQNYELLFNLEQFKLLKKPILVGISRKSMIYNKLNITPEESLNGTTILNTISIQKGANFLRVHDVKEAKEIINCLKN